MFQITVVKELIEQACNMHIRKKIDDAKQEMLEENSKIWVDLIDNVKKEILDANSKALMDLIDDAKEETFEWKNVRMGIKKKLSKARNRNILLVLLLSPRR